jgi:O-antigen/teichoic acid export membrane protein
MTETPMGNSAPTGRRRVISNSVFNTAGWAVNALTVILATPYFVGRLTASGYGVYALLGGLVGYYGLLDLGLGQGVVKFVAEFRVRNDARGINRSINAALWVQILSGAIGSTLLVLFAGGLIRLLKVPPALWADARSGIHAIAVGFFFTMISNTFSSALQGLQRYDLTARVNVMASILLTGALVMLLRLGYGLREMIWATALSAILTCAVFFYIVKRKITEWRFFERVGKESFRSIFAFSGFMFISRVSNIFCNYLVGFIIGFFLGPAAVTLYVVPWKLVSSTGAFLGSAFGVLFPYASELGALGDGKKIERTFVDASKLFASLSIPLHLTLFLFSRSILRVWMGQPFADGGWLVLSLLAMMSLLGSLSAVPNLITMGLGFSRIVGKFSLLTLAFYVGLLPIFTRQWGIEGSAWGLLVSVIPGLALVAYEVKKIIGLKIGRYVRQVFGFHLGFVIAAVAGVALFRLPLLSLPALTGAAVVFLGSYFGLLSLFHRAPIRDLIRKMKSA